MSSFTEYTNEYKKKKKKEAEILASQKKTEKTEEKRTWFDKGAFDDGYQFGDVTKTILGTAADVGENLLTGILGMGEKAVDGLAYVGASMAEQQMNEAAQNEMIFNTLTGKDVSGETTIKQYRDYSDKVKAETSEFIAKDLYDEEKIAKSIISDPLSNIGFQVEDNSALGEKSDSLVQSGGQLLGTIGLQAVGVPWWLTTGVTTFGSEIENAFNEGASYEEAGLSGLISAGAEILSEKLTGGISFGGKTLDDLIPNDFLSRISNKVVRTLIKMGVDAVGEGGEEIVSGVFSALGQKLTYASEKEFNELFSSEDALESFIGGVVLGGGSSVFNLVKSKKNGVDYVSGLTNNEKAVVDKVYNDRIAEAEKGGKKLTAKEKTKIYNEVVEALEKGAIDTDTIESVLGGEDYKKYQSEIKRQQDLENELKELRNMKSGEMTDIQIERMSELKAMKPNTEMLNTLKFSVDENIRNGIKDTRLVESYNEKARRKQAYEADLTQYDTKMQETVKKAVESGILNNTRRTHEFVDMIAKISAEKGVLFDFTNNEKLKESGFAVEGKTVNGYVTKDGVTLNVQSAKSLNSVVGHEVTHVLEGTELYGVLQQTITEYAKNKKDYDSRRKALEELYKNVEGADIDAELTADLVGDYLFTDSDFIKHLSTSNRNVFQKIYDEIKYLYKVATAGSKEARELEKVKKAFDKAYKESGEAKSDIQYSMSDSDGHKLTKEQSEYFKDSKMRDDNGNLTVMYHGSQDAGFHEFEQLFSDDNTSFFFVDNPKVAKSYSGTDETYTAKTFHTAEDFNKFFEEIGMDEYDVKEEMHGDHKWFVLYEDGVEVASSETAKMLYDEFRDWTGLGTGSANYKVYLNLTNPLIVDAKNSEWDDLRHWSKSAFISAEDVEVRRVDSEFRLFHKNTNREVSNSTVAVNSYTENMTRDSLRSLMLDKANNSLSINTESLNTTRDVSKWAKTNGYDGVIFKNIIDNGAYASGMDRFASSTVAIAFDSNQIKSVANGKPTTNPDIRYSLSKEGETPKANGRYNVYGKDVALETAPVREVVAENATPTESNIPTVNEAEMFPNEPNLYDLYGEQKALEKKIREAVETNDVDTLNSLMPSYEALLERIKQTETDQKERFASLDDADAPPEMEAPYTEGEGVTPDNPFENRDISEVGNRKVKAYMYENPEVKPFFQAEAEAMLEELKNTIKGERIYVSTPDGRPGEYGSDSLGYWTGVKRHTTADIAYLVDNLGYTYAEIEKGLKAIIEDNGKENNACSKRIEFLLNDRLMNGYQDEQLGFDIPPNQDYINLLNEKQITEYNDEARKAFFESLETESIAAETEIAPTKEYEAIKPRPEQLEGEEAQWAKNKMARADKVSEEHQTAEILDKEPEAAKEKSRWFSKFRANIVDKHSVFEDLALKTKNRELMGKANHMLSSESRAQWLIGHGTEGVKSLNDIRTEVEKTGLTKQFYEYLYHKHNIDRMNLEGRYKDVKNKPVFGYDVTAEKSQEIVNQYEFAEPMFKEYAQDVYNYMNHLRRQLVDNGVISQETADLWSEMYPHYVPIRRLGDSGLNINVPLDTGRTGVNAPIKKATGGSRDILPLFDTMAMRTEQTYRAIARNSFGVELKNTLGTGFVENKVNFEEVVDSIEKQEELLQKGENGQKPTFTVFENGKKVTFEITEDMYDALKPTNEFFAKSNKTLNKINNVRRGLITEYNPVFLVTNAVKDAQDLLMNSQHAAKTYKNFPKAIKELATKGKWYTEYMENGGEQNTYFDGKTNTFKAEDKGFKKVIGMPLRAISAANNFIERAPRLAEYIASRESGASVEVAMLDAARVTTNFAAGGQVTQWADRNGATFLNASVQGFSQQVRNVREAKANGLKGWLGLATKTAIAGIPALILNDLLWDDDEEYEELSDYVKDNYYVVAKYGDGQFVRIPKGRTVAVIQDAFEQVSNMLTGDDEADFNSFFDLFVSNLAPNNPLDNSIISPITQVMENKTWYGEDLVPTRLQDLPASEQYDESTDALSKWLGETFDMSPYKINYLLDQYSGALGDVFLPMMTPEAESGDNSLLGNIIAPFKDKFTTDSVMNNQNVSDFYETVDELTTNAKSSKATDEDILKSKYMNSISSELGELYAKKREIQNSDLSDNLKYEQVREIQKQIDAIAKESLNTYNNVSITDGYAEIGDRHFRLNDDGEWQKITDEQLEKQNDITSGLGISPSEYWQKKAEYDFAYKYPEKYEFLNKNGITYDDYNNGSEEFKEAYSWAYENPEKFTMSKAIASDVVTYRKYTSELNDIKADKDEDGKSISGSRKEKVIEYCNNLNADYGERIILFKSQYKADDTYNHDIVEYLNSREDISYSEMVTILKELGFKVDSNGNVTWD